MNNIRALLERARITLTPGSNDPALESQVLLAHVLGRDRGWLFAWPEHEPAADQIKQFEQLLAQRRHGHPVAHLTAEREFWSLRLRVSADTLIPRPETEHLVEIALDLDLPTDARVLDLGTGSGAVALALASERPGWQLVALDRSAAALEIARQNAAELGLSVQLLQSNWFDALPRDLRFDLIVSNPPYVAKGDPYLAQGDLRFEPSQALASGVDGLDDIRLIVAAAPTHLKPGGWLWLEHGNRQGAQVVDLLQQQGFEQVSLRHDLAGHERQSGGRIPPGGPTSDSG